MSRRILLALVSLVLLVWLGLPANTIAQAQQPGGNAPPVTGQPSGTGPKSFLPPQARPGTGAPVAAAPTGFYAWVTRLQQGYNQRLAKAIRDLRSSNPLLAFFSLAGLSFAYGILHAAGPGHGKAIISSYVLANEQTVRRGIALSFMAALFQALSALILVAVLLLAVKLTGGVLKSTEAWLETLSWGLVTLIGAWLVWGQVRQLRIGPGTGPGLGHEAHAHGYDRGHDHARHTHAAHAHAHVPASQGDHGPAHAAHGHHHAHHHDHVHSADGACCDHAHMPDPRQLQGAWSWPKALTLAAAIGVRPCTGAILVLVFAIGQGLAWAGVFATFAMALGTAITVSALAAIAIGSRELAARLGRDGTGWAASVRRFAGLGGSLAVFVLGLLLFIGSLGPATAF